MWFFLLQQLSLRHFEYIPLLNSPLDCVDHSRVYSYDFFHEDRLFDWIQYELVLSWQKLQRRSTLLFPSPHWKPKVVMVPTLSLWQLPVPPMTKKLPWWWQMAIQYRTGVNGRICVLHAVFHISYIFYRMQIVLQCVSFLYCTLAVWYSTATKSIRTYIHCVLMSLLNYCPKTGLCYYESCTWCLVVS